MRKLPAVITKEFLILTRDIPGLAVLFIMPVFLILAITLTQEQSKYKINNPRFGMIIIDNDSAGLGSRIEEKMEESGLLNIVTNNELTYLNIAKAEQLISEGEYQVGIYIPPGSGWNITKGIKLLSGYEDFDSDIRSFEPADSLRVIISIILDPSVNELFVRTVTSIVYVAVRSVEMEMFNDMYRILFSSGQMNVSMPGLEKRSIRNTTSGKSLIDTELTYAKIATSRITPSFIQNNVPAFALFAMFFIVIPLAGGLITEKNEGTYNRIRILQISYITILAGKVAVFSFVSVLQFMSMVLCGMYLFPAFVGIEALEIGNNIPAIVLAVFSSASAAIGFGLFIGTIFSTHGQAAMFGALMNVILCIFGGVFIPVFMMPDLLDSISSYTPLRWAMDAFITLFVRGGDISDILPDVFRLTFFFFVAVLISVLSYIRRS